MAELQVLLNETILPASRDAVRRRSGIVAAASRVSLLLILIVFMMPAFAATDAELRALDQRLASQPKESLESAEKALQAADEHGDQVAQMKALRALCRAYDVGHYMPITSKYVDRAVALAREMNDTEALAWFLYAKSQNTYMSDSAASAALLDQATALAEQHRMQYLIENIYIDRSWRAIYDGRVSDAAALSSKAYDLFEKKNDRRGMARALIQFAFFFHAQSGNGENYLPPPAEETHKALEYLGRAMDLLEPGSDVYTEHLLHFMFGIVYDVSGDYAKAKAYFRKSLPFAARLWPDTAQKAETEIRFRIGAILRKEKRYEEALTYLAGPLPPVLREEGAGAVFNLTLERAFVLAHLGRKEESLAALSQARSLLPRSIGNRIDYHLRAAAIHEMFGNYRQAVQALRDLREEEQGLAAAGNRRMADEYKARFDVQLKDSENARLRAQQKQMEAQERETEIRRLALILALAFALLLLGTVAFYLRKRAQAARTEALHHKALAEAEISANKAKSTFLANMSHELRSPLNVVLGFTQVMMRDAGLRKETRDDLGTIYKSGHHLYTLINQVLDLSKIEAGRMTLDESEVDLFGLQDELAEMFSITAEQKGLRLILKCSPEVPQYVRTDALKLRQVLINLINNALKFTREGSVTLSIEARTAPQPETCVLAFAVTDTGPGIAEDELARLGEAFVQARAGQQASEGTGLGLAISSSFVRLMGGEIRFSSRLGEGTTVAFELAVPLAEVPAVTQVASQGPRVIGLAPDQPHYRILVVDDRTESRQILVRLLTPLGFEVREAGNGEEAVTFWEDWQPHLILMDMRMPVMDGRQATRRIRAAEKGKRTVIVALTASSFESDRAQILSDGCDDFLRKPFREEALFESMHKHLGAQFIYEDTPAVPGVEPVDSMAATALPAELQEQLERALTELDSAEVERLIEVVRHHDAALADMFSQMAYRYEYARMLELLGKKENALD
jgi:signal transduction histidine kinase/DNA-binding response OmpR family regulator